MSKRRSGADGNAMSSAGLHGCTLHTSAIKISLTHTLFQQEQKVEPITGISSEGYSGVGMVQSKKAEK